MVSSALPAHRPRGRDSRGPSLGPSSALLQNFTLIGKNWEKARDALSCALKAVPGAARPAYEESQTTRILMDSTMETLGKEYKPQDYCDVVMGESGSRFCFALFI